MPYRPRKLVRGRIAQRAPVGVVDCREGYSVFRLKCRAIPPKHSPFKEGTLVISCICWAENDWHVSMSVDILYMFEHLVGETFSTQEKSRIRWNLQFLRPSTVNRKSSERIFNAVMAMEGPRSRNIEKDLKVFRWLSLNAALTKMLLKYSVNLTNNEQNHLLEEHAMGNMSANSNIAPVGSTWGGAILATIPAPVSATTLVSTIPAVSTVLLSFNTLTSLPCSVAYKAFSKEAQARPRPAIEQKPPPLPYIEMTSSWARFFVKRAIGGRACSFATY